ncbi:cathepsin L-like isoform X8 [Portunus trituberculatus]|uniref:cathepsin L-like isoform X8 n=1 Tax=Portunus trituberculatus TaxID=210409 RepID=UPI001E1CD1A3|nr:cathepsin L-like isoform X8 [Portunus trituberculatus]
MKALVVFCVVVSCLASAQLVRPDKMRLGVYNPDTKHYEKQTLGQDGHDQQPHRPALLGQDGHDQQPHEQALLGGDGHDQRPHEQALLGGDNHDLRPHGQALLGGDEHDLRPHGQPLLGQDGHDQRPHGKPLLGQDGHDQRPHGKALLGQDGHDQRPHGKILGQDGHDQQPHKQKSHKHNKHKARKVLGGDNHDRRAHKKLFGQGNHDYKKHVKVFGGDDHDMGHMGMFKSFMKQHNKSYKNKAEFKKRFKIFHQNMKKVHILQQNERGTAKYGPTKFADLTEREFRKMLGFQPHMKPATSSMEPAVIPEDLEAPVSFDWRKHGVVTPVKNQGMCGSCWAFSTTGNVEGQWAIKHKQLYSLSEQELVDCDATDDGCNGGLPENAYEAIAKLGGLELEDDYPYDGEDEQCHFNRSLAKVTVNGSVELPADEVAMAKWLTQNGPISIGINANALQFYVGGVSHPLKFLCNPESLDHGMLIVGYGVHTTKYLHRKQPFWIVKNSWGDDWGEQGYYRVYRGDGTCGVDQMATSAIVP